MDLGSFASKFREVRWLNDLKFQSACPCPTHAGGDSELSLLARLDQDHILVGCFGGVGDTTDTILAAVGLSQTDLVVNGNGKPRPSPSLQAWKVMVYRTARNILVHDAGSNPAFLASAAPDILLDGVMKDLRRGVDAGGQLNPLPDLSQTELDEELQGVARVAIKEFIAKYGAKPEGAQPQEEKPPPRALTLREYFDGYQKLIEQQWPVADTLCPGCVSLLTSKKGVGKSTLLRQLVESGILGLPFLGREVGGALRVLYLPLEAGGMPVILGFQKAGLSLDLPNFRVQDQIPADCRTLPERLAWVKALILDFEPQLVIIDTLGRFSVLGGNDDYGGTTEIVGELEKVARETNSHILYSHHVGKNRSEDAELTGAALGSAGIETAAQAHIHLRKRTKGLVTIEIGDMRVGQALPETVLVWNELDDSVELSDLWSTQNAMMLEVTKKAVEAFMKMAPPDDWFSTSMVAKELNTGPRWISWALSTLSKAGLLERDGKGKRGSPYVYRVKQEKVAEPSAEAEPEQEQEELWNSRR